MTKCTIKHIRKKYNSTVSVDYSQNLPVNVLECTDSLAKAHQEDGLEQIVFKKYIFIHLLMLLKVVDCQKLLRIIASLYLILLGQ